MRFPNIFKQNFTNKLFRKSEISNHSFKYGYIKKRIIVHADDFGINKEITDNILDCINNGLVSSASIICNTKDFKYAIEKYKSNSISFQIRLHLNLVEGAPLMPKEEVYLLYRQ